MDELYQVADSLNHYDALWISMLSYSAVGFGSKLIGKRDARKADEKDSSVMALETRDYLSEAAENHENMYWASVKEGFRHPVKFHYHLGVREVLEEEYGNLVNGDSISEEL